MIRRRARSTGILAAAAIAVLAYLTAPPSGAPAPTRSSSALPVTPAAGVPTLAAGEAGLAAGVTGTIDSDPLPGMPPIASASDIYADDAPGDFSPAARSARPLIYVPDTISGDVYEINPATDQVVAHFLVGKDPQHVVPSYDGSTLWVTVDGSNTLVPINPQTGAPGPAVPVADPYNLYFTPDGQHAIVVAEALKRLDFRDPQTMALPHSLAVPTCAGVNHMDFTANGRYLLATCEFSYLQGLPGRLIVVDVANERLVTTIDLGPGSQPQDVKLSPDGTTFYVSDLRDNGVWLISATTFAKIGFIPTGAGAHGLYVSRDHKDLYVSDRNQGEVSVIAFATNSVVATWKIPGGGSPDMGNVSNDGSVLWLSGRYNNVVYAFDTASGALLAKVPVGRGPHGVCVWPQPGRYSLGHTGILR
jgi:DNA-binding beta-propeller fold protein YncE